MLAPGRDAIGWRQRILRRPFSEEVGATAGGRLAQRRTGHEQAGQSQPKTRAQQ
jgi:hypothetical protein